MKYQITVLEDYHCRYAIIPKAIPTNRRSNGKIKFVHLPNNVPLSTLLQHNRNSVIFSHTLAPPCQLMPLTQGTPLSQHPPQCHPYPQNISNQNAVPHVTVSTSASCRSQSLAAACAQGKFPSAADGGLQAPAPQPAACMMPPLKQDFLLIRGVPCASDTFPPWPNQASSMLLLPLSRPNACSVTEPKRSSSNSSKRTHHTENFWHASSSMKPSRYVD